MKKECFYGIYGMQFIYNGQWSDPEVIWHGKSFNYFDLENCLWDMFKEECAEDGREIIEHDFPIWVKKNSSFARDILSQLAENRCYYGEA
jgi:hypothetical protein